MKIVVIGSTGTLGSAVVTLLKKEHRVVGASRSSGLTVDLEDPHTMATIFKEHPDVDAILCVAGHGAFGQLDALSDAEIKMGMDNKLLGQINLVRLARKYMKENGVVVLTTGILAQNPNPQSSMLTMINRGLEGFVEAASMDMPKHMKLHAVSPPLAQETAEKMGWGGGGVPAAEIATLYQKALTSPQQGKIFSF